jgi:protein TonB
MQGRGRNETETVVIEVEVSETGQVRNSRVKKSSGIENVDRATIERFSGCRYQPAYVGESPVPSVMTIEMVWKTD